MKFSISSHNSNGLAQVLLMDSASGAQVGLLPAHGVMLHAFEVETRNGRYNLIDNYADAAELENQLATSFKSSKLSPFVCRIPAGRYRHEGTEFELQHKFMDGSAIHGLLYNKAFEETDAVADEHKASVAYKYRYEKEDSGYPFSYSCEIRYNLLPQNTLQLQTTVTNMDALAIPIADGWHPYFRLGGKVDDYWLCFAAGSMVEFDDKLVPTGRLLPYDRFNAGKQIRDTSLDNCFLPGTGEGQPLCTLRNEQMGLQLNLLADASYPYLQIYTPLHRESIAIENLSGAPDAFNNHMGLLLLQPGRSHTFTVSYQVGCQ